VQYLQRIYSLKIPWDSLISSGYSNGNLISRRAIQPRAA
jgi:hypothetical protein